MAPDPPGLRALYRKLLRLYPRDFYEQMGESMEQTFNDLYRERASERARGWLGFVLWMFVETAAGILKEYILQITQGEVMKNVFTYPRSAVIISFIFVVPFMILELVNRRSFHEGFPIPLFGILWLLPMTFIGILMPIVRNVRAGNGVIANPVSLMLRVTLLALITWLWAAIMMDQFPCFLGVPNCD